MRGERSRRREEKGRKEDREMNTNKYSQSVPACVLCP